MKTINERIFLKNHLDKLNKMSTKNRINNHFHFNKKIPKNIIKNNILINIMKENIEGFDTFDPIFYGSYYSDLSHMTNEQLFWHYELYGKNEKRAINEYQLYIKYQKLDLDFYGSYRDLCHMTQTQLINHYNTYGINELDNNRFTNEKQLEEYFYKVYPDFDIEFYKSNEDLKGMTSIELMKHYHFFGHILNNTYFTNDFIVNDNYEIEELDPAKTCLVNSHAYFRAINNYENLIEYRKNYDRKYFIYNKETFYIYYSDFDYEYYKNRYFPNANNISEKELLIYYHTEGKYKKHVTNNKINLLLYIPPYNLKCGGITVTHYFAKLINEKYNDKFRAKLFMHNNLRYKNPFCNDYAKLEDIHDNSVVIYPEIVSGNPLNSKHVVRWILLELGIEMPIEHSHSWGKDDLIYHWETIDKQLSCPFFNNTFINKKLPNRNKTCYLEKKGYLIHKNIQHIHPNDSIKIDDFSLSEINTIFNECKYFYSYDANTAYIIYAAVCGCIPIIYPIEGVSEEDYFNSKIYKFDNTIHNRGIIYGINDHKLNNIIINKLNENNEEYYRELFNKYEKKTIPPFLNDICEYFEKNK